MAALAVALPGTAAAAAAGGGGPMILRVRLGDGSVARISVAEGREGTTTLADVLARADTTGGGGSSGGSSGERAVRAKVGAEEVDAGRTVADLGLRHGSLVAIVPPPRKKGEREEEEEEKAGNRFDPFPALAKPLAHSTAARRARARAHSARGQSYAAISALRESLHSVEPQPTGPVARVYMCARSAERFRDGCTVRPTRRQITAAKRAGKTEMPASRIVNRVGLLMGTVGTERRDQKKDLTRTSLSTPLYEREMCDVVRVHAVWEHPSQPAADGTRYDAGALCQRDEDGNVRKALRVGGALGLRPVGWVYSYAEDRHAPSGSESGPRSSSDAEADEDALPVYGSDVYHGALLQIGNMRSERLGREEGAKFVTLALDARSGAAEAFQLSDVSVQIVAEGLIRSPPTKKEVSAGGGGKGKSKKASNAGASKPNGRYLTTTDVVLIDALETTELDSVLCLVNTALLGHTGSYCGEQAESSVTKKGQLTAKAKKQLLSAIDGGGGGDSKLFEKLCDFSSLVALDGLLPRPMADELFRLVRKWSRGQRRGVEMGDDLKVALRSVLGGV